MAMRGLWDGPCARYTPCTMEDGGSDNAAALAALERFVVDNDDLLALEEKVGRFNIFDALDIIDVEIRHSNFLAWLLDPIESHNQGGLFLRVFLMDLLRQSDPAQRPRGLSPITLDGGELRGVEIRREWRNIDLLIRCDEPPFVIAIENKIRSGEHSDQLSRYKKIVSEQFGDVPRQFVFLTPEGDEPSDEDWTVYDYRSLHTVLRRVVDANRTAISDDVLAFLEHYLRVLRSRLMDDPQIDELCQRIYQNHRQAIDLIFEHGGFGTSRFAHTIEQLVTNDSRFDFLNRGAQRVSFLPVAWRNMLPPVGRERLIGPTNWLQLVLRVTETACVLRCDVRPTNDLDLRSKVVERLTRDPSEFGLKSFFKNREHIGSNYATLGRETVLTWKADDGLDEEKLVAAVNAKLDQWHQRLVGIPDALRPIIEQWQRERGEVGR